MPARSRLSRALTGALALAALTASGASATQPAKPGAESDLSQRLWILSTKEVRTAPPAEQAEVLSLPARGAGSLYRRGGDVVVEIRVAGSSGARVAGVVATGAETLHVSPRYATITAAIGERDLRELARAPGVESVTEVLTPLVSRASGSERAPISTCTGSVTTEADGQLKAGAARTQFNVDGAGVKVGVLSDSYDTATGESTHAANDVATGDLPGPGNPCGRTTPVQLLADAAGGTDEGRAMLQLVHDLAPGSPLAFATAIGGEAVFAANIRALANAGARVIVDDISYFAEPAFQDGAIAQAVNDVTAGGVTYYSSAGNNNIINAGNDVGSWEAPAFRQAGACPTGVPSYATQCMDFDPGAGTDSTYAFTVGAGRTVRIALHWAQPQSGVTTDLDAYVMSGTTVVDSAEDTNLTTQKPFEFLSVTNSDSSPAVAQIVINRYVGTGGGDTATPRLKLIHLNNGSSASFPSEYATSTGGDIVGPTIFGHNGANNAISTAAVPYNNAATVEGFSSRGPVTHYFGPVSGTTPAPALGSPQVLNKPDVAATDGGLTTFFGGGNRFFGTSAAAPDAAAVAALQLDANPAQTVAQVKAAQKATADPVGAFGPTAVGSGLVDALGAVAVNPPPPPTVAITSAPEGTTNDSTPTIEFTTTGDLSAISCAIDGAAAAPCVSPFTTAPLGDGSHTLAMQVADYFGRNASTSLAFAVDATGPAAKITKGPKRKTTKGKAKFAFSSPDPGASFECKLDGRAFKRCASPTKVKVKPGKHKFRVRATDAAGNTGPTAKRSWKRKKRR